MGKLPPSMRSSASFALTNLLKTPASSQKPQVIPRSSKKKPQVIQQFPKKKPQLNPQSRSQSPIVTFTSPSLSEAKTLFTSLISDPKKAPSDLRFYNSILQSFSSVSTLQDAIFFLNHMVKTHPPFSPDRSTYHVLLIQACKSSDESLSPVYQILNLMNTNGFPPNIVSTDISVRALCISGREEHAIELVKDLCSKNSPPDSHTYNFLVRHLCKNRSVSTMNGFVRDMKEEFSIKPDLVTYTIMIDNVCNNKNLREATRLLGVLSEEGYKPDCYVYNTIMKGYCMLSTGGEVLDVYKKMLDEGVKPDLGVELYGMMKQSSMKLETGAYGTFVRSLCRNGRVAEAYEVFDYAVESKSLTDVAAYTTLESTLKWLTKAREQGLV
nr:pentatricopeptide repeat-containing protein At2g17670 [Ipomoea trifida]